MSFVEDMVNQFMVNIGKSGQAIADSIREHVPTELGQDQIVDLGSEPEVPQGQGQPDGSDGYDNEDSSGTTNVASQASLQSVNGVTASAGEVWYYQKAQELQVQHPDWNLAKLTDKMSELIWNNNYNALMSDIANSRTPEEREQKISEHQLELDNYKDSGIDVANDIQYLRDNQGMETFSLFNKVASLISSYSYGGVEAQSILSPSNTAFDNVEYAADGTFTEINPDGVSSDEAIQQSEDRIKVFNGIWQEFSDFFSNPIVENLPLILGGTVVSTGLELQNSANPFGLSKGAGKAGDANDTQDTKSGNDPLKFKFGYFQSDGAPVFYATKDVVVQGSSKADNTLYEFNIGGYGFRIVDDSAAQKALLSAKVQEWARGMEFLGTGYSAGGLVPKGAAIAEKVMQGLKAAETVVKDPTQLLATQAERAAAQKAAQEESRIASTRGWFNEAGKPYWPEKGGFVNTPVKIRLEEGTLFSRYGLTEGRYASPAGTTYEMRALAPGTENETVWEVVKQFDAFGGEITPWFDQPGRGIQYKFNESVQWLKDNGYIKAYIER